MPDDVSDMRVDIGRMAEKMDSLAETMKEYIKRAEVCQQDHEARLRAVETAALAVAQIADLKTQLDTAEKKIGVIEKALTTAEAGWTTVARIGAIAGGVVGTICGIIGACVAIFSIFRGFP